MPSEYEDKYLLLRDENTALKKKKNEQEATIKRCATNKTTLRLVAGSTLIFILFTFYLSMYTKLAMIEEKLSRKRQSEGKNNQDDPGTAQVQGHTSLIMYLNRFL